MRSKRKEGHPLAETADMKAWKKEFEKLSLSDHEEKLRSLGLDDEDLEEFKNEFNNGTKKKNKEEQE